MESGFNGKKGFFRHSSNGLMEYNPELEALNKNRRLNRTCMIVVRKHTIKTLSFCVKEEFSFSSRGTINFLSLLVYKASRERTTKVINIKIIM